jgi:hypothetical protein
VASFVAEEAANNTNCFTVEVVKKRQGGVLIAPVLSK